MSHDFESYPPPEPGIDGLAAPLQQFFDELEQQRLAQHDQEVQLAEFIPVQQVIAAEVERGVLQPRRVIWEAAEQVLNQSAPYSITPHYYDRYPAPPILQGANAVWRFESLRNEEDGREAVIHTTVSTNDVFVGNLKADPQVPSILTAITYLDNKSAVAKVPDQLLDVAAQGWWRGKQLPTDELRFNLAQTLLTRTNQLDCQVTADLPGTAERKTPLEFTAFKYGYDWGFLPHENVDWDDHLRKFDVTQAAKLHAAIRRHDDIPNPTPQDAEAYLRMMYCVSIGQGYENLATVGQVLQRSSPVVPRARS